MAMAMRADEGFEPRVFVEDSRRHGGFARITWHAEARQFVLSNWEGNVCVGATRVRVEDVPIVIRVLADGLAEAATAATATASPPPPTTLRQHLRAWWRDRSPLRSPVSVRDHRR
jgi:hypothetical protein